MTDDQYRKLPLRKPWTYNCARGCIEELINGGLYPGITSGKKPREGGLSGGGGGFINGVKLKSVSRQAT